MTSTHSTPKGGPPTPQDIWSAGDYDRLASYSSASEASHLVRFAGLRAGQTVLDVGTGSGVVAIIAAQRGARVSGVDPTPELLAKAKENAAIAGTDDITWKGGLAEQLPFADASFDVVLSQYGHMFSPQPEAATREMLRVLRPGGRIAFAAWTPSGAIPPLFGLGLRYMPPTPGPPPPSPFIWGDPEGARRYLGEHVRDIYFEHTALMHPALSPAHFRRQFEELFPPTALLVRALSAEPARLAAWRREHDALTAPYWAEGRMRFEYLLTRATKA